MTPFFRCRRLKPALFIVALLGALTGGCGGGSSASSAKYTPDQLAAIRADFQRTNPEARVGVVDAVAPDVNLARVGNVDAVDFLTGNLITFIDERGKILTTGKVVSISDGRLKVRYVNPAAGVRPPAVGDLAVRAIR